MFFVLFPSLAGGGNVWLLVAGGGAGQPENCHIARRLSVNPRSSNTFVECNLYVLSGAFLPASSIGSFEWFLGARDSRALRAEKSVRAIRRKLCELANLEEGAIKRTEIRRGQKTDLT